MKRKRFFSTGALLLCAGAAVCQNTDRPPNGSVPIYRVTVIQRSVKAINYQYRSGPTRIDFAGTVLLSNGKGEATVESKRGRTEIEAKFDHMEETARFGREYLTYVLWAVSPEGRPHNLGEIIPDGSNKAKLRVSTDLQAFGLIVTAEPYSAVRQPSDVVVLENRVRPETEGKIEEINARFELLPRGQYTWETPANLKTSLASAPKISMDQYEALTELYQAQNAIGIAEVANAQQYAPNTLIKARELLEEARRLQGARAGTKLVVQSAREAAQTAEDARVIAVRRQQDETLAKAQLEASSAQQARVQADADAQQARLDADAARSQAEAERAARQRAEADAAAAHERAAQARAEADANRAQAAALSVRQQRDQTLTQKTALRMRLLEQFNGVLATRDSPRGLVATVSDATFSGPLLRGVGLDQMARIAAIVAAHPGLRVDIEGHTDSAATETLAWRRAEAVRTAMLGRGIDPNALVARGLGSTHLLVSNATASGREQNRRVEIVISGDLIGNLPFWDHSYTLSQR